MQKESQKPAKKQKQTKELDYKQSHKLTMARYDYTPVEMRIFLSIIYLTDRYAHNGTYKDIIGEIEKGDYQQMVMKLPIKMLLGNEFEDGAVSRNHKCVRDALRSFSQKPIAFYDDELEEWRDTYPFVMTEGAKSKGYISAHISPQMWKFLQGITGKYSMLNVGNMMVMRSKYTIRMHQIVEGLMRPITFKVETLKEMFMLEDKYKNTNHFFEKVLETSRQELDERNLTSFEYEKEARIKEGRGKPKISHVTIKPKYQTYMDPKTVKKVAKAYGLTYLLTEDEITALVKLGFRQDEIMNNIDSIYYFSRFFDLKCECRAFSMYWQNDDIKNPKGCVIAEIQRKVEMLGLML